MDSEIQIKYKSLLVHHLEKEEVEFELDVRAVAFEQTESVGVLRRRLRETLKQEKNKQIELDFARCVNRSIDNEIKLIDDSVRDIKDILEKKKNFEGTKDALKTRLVHYFARCSTIQEAAEEDADLEDLDKILSTVRQLYNSFFTIFTPNESIRKEIMLQISNSLTQLQLAQPGTSGVSKEVQSRSQGTQTDDDLVGHSDDGAGARPARRQLKSNFDQVEEFRTADRVPTRSQLQSGSGLNSNRSENREIVLNRFDLSGNVRNSARKIYRKVDSDSSSSLSPPNRFNSRSQRSHTRRSRPVSDWNLRYDGRDGGQGLMRFIKEVEFYANSENISERELFRSAIHLFTGAAKIWFMSGMENGEFASWKDLVSEMKKEFLSPDHDHVSEFRAIERKQRPKEKFQDFFFDMQRLFNSLTKPISERKKYEIVFRNLRADYKGYVVAASIDNLADLKPFGRKLDATFWYKYESRNIEENTKNRHQVSELNTNLKSKPTNSVSRPEKSWLEQRPISKATEEKNSKKANAAECQPVERNQGHNNIQDKGLLVRLEKYIVPKPGICFNCRISGHHQSECRAPRHKFCFRCGFYNVETADCPYCAKNA